MKSSTNSIRWLTIENMVQEMLEKYPFTRNSDQLLECMIVQEMGYGDRLFVDVMRNRKELGIPNLATVERARRKLQRQHEHLRANEKVEIARMDMQNDFINYARGNI